MTHWIQGAVGAGLVVAVAASSVAAADEPRPLTVFAAASLTEAFTAIGHVVEQREPTVKVTFNFAGSQQLAAQIEQGANADVFASADQAWMKHVEEKNLLSGAPQIFACNRLVVVVPKKNPAKIERLQDLARAGVKVVMAAAPVPAGRYGREALDKMSRDPAFGSDFAAKVLHNVVSEEENVKAVLAKVQLGEADAGLIYRSDASGKAAAAVSVLDIPDALNVEARYPIALIKRDPPSAAAQAFIDLVLSADGQRILAQYSFQEFTTETQRHREKDRN